MDEQKVSDVGFEKENGRTEGIWKSDANHVRSTITEATMMIRVKPEKRRQGPSGHLPLLIAGRAKKLVQLSVRCAQESLRRCPKSGPYGFRSATCHQQLKIQLWPRAPFKRRSLGVPGKHASPALPSTECPRLPRTHAHQRATPPALT